MDPFYLVTPHPHVTGFPRNSVSSAQLRHAAQTSLVLQNKSGAFFHDTTLFPGHVLVLHALRFLCSVRNLPGLFCQPCLRSVPFPTQAKRGLEWATRPSFFVAENSSA